jgi:4-hydroxyphenylpyruvate dioxygenase
VPGEKLFFVQLADAPRLDMDALSWSRHFRNFPGQGDLDVTGFVRAAAQARRHPAPAPL